VPPCAEVLSVAGFLVIIGPFLAGRRFILRVRTGLSAPHVPLLFNTPFNTACNTRAAGAGTTHPCVQGGMYGQSTPTQGTQGGIREAYIPGIYHPGYTERPLCASYLSPREAGRLSAQRLLLLP